MQMQSNEQKQVADKYTQIYDVCYEMQIYLSELKICN